MSVWWRVVPWNAIALCLWKRCLLTGREEVMLHHSVVYSVLVCWLCLRFSECLHACFRGYRTAVFISAHISSLAEGSCRRKAWYRADMKTSMWLFIIRSNLPIRHRISCFICHLLYLLSTRIMLKVTDEWLIDRLLQCLYSMLAPAATTNQRRPSLPVTYGHSKLCYSL